MKFIIRLMPYRWYAPLFDNDVLQCHYKCNAYKFDTKEEAQLTCDQLRKHPYWSEAVVQKYDPNKQSSMAKAITAIVEASVVDVFEPKSEEEEQ